MNVEFIKVCEPEQIASVARMADSVWHEHYAELLSQSQIDYMVEKYQSLEAIKDQLDNQGYEYYLLSIAEGEVGYVGIKLEDKKLFLSKLYIASANRGKGYASAAFEFLKSLCSENNLPAIYLTVNKYNRSSIDVYRHKGFHIIDSVVTPIGNGYVMDDYIMEKTISI